MKIALIYASKYGATKQYAQWVAEATGVTLLERKHVLPSELKEYDGIIYGGGLYAGGIAGIKLVTKRACNLLAVFTVGLSNPATTDFSDIMAKNLPMSLRETAAVFHLRGGIDYSRLSFQHKAMMRMLRQMLRKKPPQERTAEDEGILETYGAQVDFADKESILPLVEYIQAHIQYSNQ